MNALTIDPATVSGWGVDADPRNDPTYPYRDRSHDGGLTKDWKRPTLQQSDVEVLQSIEHIRRPAVFGTSTPPRGVSGAVRRVAFRWSESNWTHWLLLMGADRIDMVEGLVEDLARLKVPNIPGEMGARAETEHDRRGLAAKVGIAVAATGLVVLLARRRSRRKAPARVPARSGQRVTTRLAGQEQAGQRGAHQIGQAAGDQRPYP